MRHRNSVERLTMKDIKQYKGFTIIEVVLVLAVAGLIFLMVFVALPALQRSQHDTQRRDDYGMLASAITSYSASNNGRLYKLAGATGKDSPSCKPLTASKYIKDDGNGVAEDPGGNKYDLEACTWGEFEKKITGNKAPSDFKAGDVYVVIGADCTGTSEDGADLPAKNDQRTFVIYGYLETGSGTYCSVTSY